LRVQLDSPLILVGEALNLLDEAEFRAVLPIQERRNDREAQVNPALELLEPEQFG
jgi:hypothetical protein